MHVASQVFFRSTAAGFVAFASRQFAPMSNRGPLTTLYVFVLFVLPEQEYRAANATRGAKRLV